MWKYQIFVLIMLSPIFFIVVIAAIKNDRAINEMNDMIEERRKSIKERRKLHEELMEDMKNDD